MSKVARLPRAQSDWSEVWGNELIRKVQRSLDNLAAAQTPHYTLEAAPTADRSFDPTSTTAAELGQVLGTLIQDLQQAGVIG